VLPEDGILRENPRAVTTLAEFIAWRVPPCKACANNRYRCLLGEKEICILWPRRKLVAVILMIAIAATGLVLRLPFGNAGPPRLTAHDPLIDIHEGFVPEETCVSCHSDAAAAFAKSHHAKAMALASASTVLADFNDSRFEHDGLETRFFRKGDSYFVRAEGPDGKPAEFEVKYTFGYKPLQQYLIELPGGKLQAFDIAWDTERKSWFWLGEGLRAASGSTFHWSGAFYRWNRTCADCHSTDVRVGVDAASNQYASSYVAASIGCQSCHGPGAKHAEWAGLHASGQSTSLDKTKGLVTVDTGQVCFACHSRRSKLADGYTPDKPYLDYFSPSLIRNDLYFPDGQILEEDYEYGSFQQSKMARAGVVCVDCHKPHEATLRAEGNAVCAQCHTETPPARFANAHPGGVFDTPGHTHHPMGSPGAQCANCHMPQRTYMKVDPRRDHSIVIPRPDLSAAYGTPNACTSCHRDKTNSWAAERMDTWYGTQWRGRPSSVQTLAAAWRDGANPVVDLAKLVNDRTQAGIMRGSALTEIGRFGGPAATAAIKAGAADAEPLVRLGAAEGAAFLPQATRLEAVGRLTRDPTRAVRLAAIRALGDVPPDNLAGEDGAAFDHAVQDLMEYARANALFAEAQSELGVFMIRQRRLGDAEAAFRRSITLDPTFAGAHSNLAELFRAMGRNDESEKTYATAVAAAPNLAELRYGHALALVRVRRLEDAIGQLREAVRLDPDNIRYASTLAIALDSVGRSGDAFDMLSAAAAKRNQSDPDILGTLVPLGLKLGRYRETLPFAEALARLNPADPNIARVVQQLRAANTAP
jgi:predicted CXXCH cytochrome family protein